MNRPGRTRTYSPRFWSALLATPASKRLLIFKDLALDQQRRRRWTTPALTLFQTLSTRGPHGISKDASASKVGTYIEASKTEELAQSPSEIGDLALRHE